MQLLRPYHVGYFMTMGFSLYNLLGYMIHMKSATRDSLYCINSTLYMRSSSGFLLLIHGIVGHAHLACHLKPEAWDSDTLGVRFWKAVPIWAAVYISLAFDHVGIVASMVASSEAPRGKEVPLPLSASFAASYTRQHNLPTRVLRKIGAGPPWLSNRRFCAVDVIVDVTSYGYRYHSYGRLSGRTKSDPHRKDAMAVRQV